MSIANSRSSLESAASGRPQTELGQFVVTWGKVLSGSEVSAIEGLGALLQMSETTILITQSADISHYYSTLSHLLACLPSSRPDVLRLLTHLSSTHEGATQFCKSHSLQFAIDSLSLDSSHLLMNLLILDLLGKTAERGDSYARQIAAQGAPAAITAFMARFDSTAPTKLIRRCTWCLDTFPKYPDIFELPDIDAAAADAVRALKRLATAEPGDRGQSSPTSVADLLWLLVGLYQTRLREVDMSVVNEVFIDAIAPHLLSSQTSHPAARLLSCCVALLRPDRASALVIRPHILHSFRVALLDQGAHWDTHRSIGRVLCTVVGLSEEACQELIRLDFAGDVFTQLLLTLPTGRPTDGEGPREVAQTVVGALDKQRTWVLWVLLTPFVHLLSSFTGLCHREGVDYFHRSGFLRLLGALVACGHSRLDWDADRKGESSTAFATILEHAFTMGDLNEAGQPLRALARARQEQAVGGRDVAAAEAQARQNVYSEAFLTPLFDYAASGWLRKPTRTARAVIQRVLLHRPLAQRELCTRAGLVWESEGEQLFERLEDASSDGD